MSSQLRVGDQVLRMLKPPFEPLYHHGIVYSINADNILESMIFEFGAEDYDKDKAKPQLISLKEFSKSGKVYIRRYHPHITTNNIEIIRTRIDEVLKDGLDSYCAITNNCEIIATMIVLTPESYKLIPTQCSTILTVIGIISLWYQPKLIPVAINGYDQLKDTIPLSIPIPALYWDDILLNAYSI